MDLKVQKRIAAKFSTKTLSIGDYLPKNYGYSSDLISYGASDNPRSLPKKDKNLIIYVGRLDKNIAVMKIFQVLNKLKGFKIEILGDGILKENAKLYGKTLGWTDPTSYYKKAKYIFASGYLTVLEALSSRCLVFATYDNPLQKDYYLLTPFRKYIVISGDPQELYEKFIYYQEHPKEADKIIEKGYHWAKMQTWEKMTNNYLDLWKNIK